jgi:ABC-type glycerol-3-phosphate transport system substrate-binding protein
MTKSPFQLILLGVFLFLLVIGILVFAGILPGFRAPSGGTGGAVTWWGTLPQAALAEPLADFKKAHEDEFTINYVEKDPATLQADLIEALAAGVGPDIVTETLDWTLKNRDKVAPIAYANLSERLFRDTFVRGSDLLLDPEGVLGLPLYVDPVVLYYNTDLLAKARLAAAPRTWTELGAAVKSLTTVDERNNVLQSALPLGRFNNIPNAKDLLALLIMQAGNPLVSRTKAGQPEAVLDSLSGFAKQPAGEAVTFFNHFADPANSLYAWNSSLPSARAAFARGESAMYLGSASELGIIQAQNPQLNFDVAPVPQRSESGTNLTFGRLHYLMLTKASKNPVTALRAAYSIVSGPLAPALAQAAGLPSALTAELKKTPADPYEAVFYQAALVARGWLDPDPAASAAILRNLAEGTAIGRSSLGDALKEAQLKLANLIK